MTEQEGVEKIEELINELSDESDELYITLLEEMIERAQNALAARKEELGEG
jgi:hypothetical protein